MCLNGYRLHDNNSPLSSIIGRNTHHTASLYSPSHGLSCGGGAAFHWTIRLLASLLLLMGVDVISPRQWFLAELHGLHWAAPAEGVFSPDTGPHCTTR